MERRGFARAASRARRGSRVNVARRTSGRRASRPAGFAELLPVALRLRLRDGRVGLRGADHRRRGGFLRRGRRARGFHQRPDDRAGEHLPGFLRRGRRARGLPGEPRRGHAGPRRRRRRPLVPLVLRPQPLSPRRGHRGLAPRRHRPLLLRRRHGLRRNGAVLVARGRRLLLASGGLAVRLAVVLLVLLRRRLAVLLVLLLRRRLLVLLLVVLLVLLGGRLAVVPLLLRGRGARGRRTRGLVGVFPLLGVIVLLSSFVRGWMRNGEGDARGGGGDSQTAEDRDGRAARARARQSRRRDASARRAVDTRRVSPRVRRAGRLGSRPGSRSTSTRFFSPIADHAPTPWGAASTAVPRKVSEAGTGCTPTRRRARGSAVRRIGDRRGASRSGKAGVHEGCLDRGADAAFLESLSPNPEKPCARSAWGSQGSRRARGPRAGWEPRDRAGSPRPRTSIRMVASSMLA